MYFVLFSIHISPGIDWQIKRNPLAMFLFSKLLDCNLEFILRVKCDNFPYTFYVFFYCQSTCEICVLKTPFLKRKRNFKSSITWWNYDLLKKVKKMKGIKNIGEKYNIRHNYLWWYIKSMCFIQRHHSFMYLISNI